MSRETPPGAHYNGQAERCVIGDCLTWPSGLNFHAKSLTPAHFHEPANRLLFATLASFHAQKLFPDLDAVIEKLKDGGWSDAEIADFEIHAIDCCESVSSCSMYEIHQHEVREKWFARSMSEVSEKLSSGEIGTAEAVKQMADLSDSAHSKPVECGLIGDFISTGPKRGTPTSYRFLNSNTVTGGWPHAQMSAVLAYQGGGKSAFMLQDASEIAFNEGPVAYATFADLSREDCADRLIKNISGFSTEGSAAASSRADHECYLRAVSHVKALPIHVYDATKARNGRDVESFISWLKKTHETHGLKVAYLDYIQKVRTQKTTKSDLDTLTIVSDKIQECVAQLSIPGIVGSQITLGSTALGTQDITKGGRVVMEDAALVLKLKIFKDDERLKLDSPFDAIPGCTLFHLEKNRFGESDLRVMNQWNKHYAKFVEL